MELGIYEKEDVMEYFIAIDSGGTKTDAVLFDETGHVWQRDVSQGANGNDIGKENARDILLSAIQRLSAQAPKPIKAVYGGVAGGTYYGGYFCEEIHPQINAEKLRIETDTGELISGMVGHVEGCGMVCGTGSGLGVRKFDRKNFVIGGRGYLIDAKGSGFAIAQEGMRRAIRAVDGRDQQTVLVELFERELGEDLDSAMPRIYKGGRPYIASFAHLVFEGRGMGDRVCYEIIENASFQLAELTYAAEKHFEGEFPVVMGGGIVQAYPFYADLVKAKASPRAKMILSNAAPVYGAAVEAMWDGGCTCDEAFKEIFVKEYVELKKNAK